MPWIGHNGICGFVWRYPDVVGRPQLAARLQEKGVGVKGRNLMGQTSVLENGLAQVSVRQNERSSAIGERNVGDSIRRRDVGGRAIVHPN
jgi:hypothetical protein